MSLLAEKAEIYFTGDLGEKKLINGALRRAKGQRKAIIVSL